MFMITRLPYIQVIFVMKHRFLACFILDLEYCCLIMVPKTSSLLPNTTTKSFIVVTTAQNLLRVSISSLQQSQNNPGQSLEDFQHPLMDTHTKWVVTISYVFLFLFTSND